MAVPLECTDSIKSLSLEPKPQQAAIPSETDAFGSGTNSFSFTEVVPTPVAESVATSPSFTKPTAILASAVPEESEANPSYVRGYNDAVKDTQSKQRCRRSGQSQSQPSCSCTIPSHHSQQPPTKGQPYESAAEESASVSSLAPENSFSDSLDHYQHDTEIDFGTYEVWDNILFSFIMGFRVGCEAPATKSPTDLREEIRELEQIRRRVQELRTIVRAKATRRWSELNEQSAARKSHAGHRNAEPSQEEARREPQQGLRRSTLERLAQIRQARLDQIWDEERGRVTEAVVEGQREAEEQRQFEECLALARRFFEQRRLSDEQRLAEATDAGAEQQRRERLVAEREIESLRRWSEQRARLREREAAQDRRAKREAERERLGSREIPQPRDRRDQRTQSVVLGDCLTRLLVNEILARERTMER